MKIESTTPIDPALEAQAKELFTIIHTRLGHAEWLGSEPQPFEHPPRKAAWIEIARAFRDRVRLRERLNKSRWLDEYSYGYALFRHVHEALGDPVDSASTAAGSYSREGFDSIEGRYRAWREIGRYFDEQSRS